MKDFFFVQFIHMSLPVWPTIKIFFLLLHALPMPMPISNYTSFFIYFGPFSRLSMVHFFLVMLSNFYVKNV